MPVPVPTRSTRWRCALCGNLTRFDVQRSTRSREFVHVSLAGEAVVEDRQVVAETVEQVTCRWCGRSDSIELVPRPGEPGAPDPADAPADALSPADNRGPADIPSEPAEHPAGS
jgi:hypothetical protein